MNGRLSLTVSVMVTASLVVGIGAGCAGKSMSKTGSGDVVAERQRLMRLQGANVGDIVAKLRAGNVEGIAVNAETLAILGSRIPEYFPDGSITDKSNALPEIWSKRAEFDAAAKNLTARAEELRNAARAKDQPKVEAMMKDFAQQTCGGCHAPGPAKFRKALPPRS